MKRYERLNQAIILLSSITLLTLQVVCLPLLAYIVFWTIVCWKIELSLKWTRGGWVERVLVSGFNLHVGCSISAVTIDNMICLSIR